MRPSVIASTFVLLLGSAPSQGVTATATGAITCTITSSSNGTSSQSLPPGSPLTNGTTVGTLNASSVVIGLATNVSPTVAARYSVTESAYSSSYYMYPPYSSGSGTTSSSTTLALTAGQPMLARLRIAWTHTGSILGFGGAGLHIDLAGSTIAWSPYVPLGPGTDSMVFLVPLGTTPTLVNTATSTASHCYGLIATWTTSSQLVIDVEPVTTPLPRCSASSYSPPCGSSLAMTDLGGGVLTFAPTLNVSTPGDPVVLALGFQPQSLPLPLSSGCIFGVTAFATCFAFVGPAPTTWICDAHAPIGPFVFDAQVVHLDAGQVFASDALQVTCQ